MKTAFRQGEPDGMLAFDGMAVRMPLPAPMLLDDLLQIGVADGLERHC